MIEKTGMKRQIVCDICEKECTDVYHEEDFNAMIHEARADGWAITRDGDDWQHICPNCVGGKITVV